MALRRAPGYDYWQGRIDELAVFNRAIPEDDIRRLYEARRFPHENGTKRAEQKQGRNRE